jgi:hypothetical protein
MVLSLVGNFLCRAGWVISGLLLFDFPPTIFAYSGFVSRLTNIDEAVEIGFICTAMAGLSWLAGRAMAVVLGRIQRTPLGRWPRCRFQLKSGLTSAPRCPQA